MADLSKNLICCLHLLAAYFFAALQVIFITEFLTRSATLLLHRVLVLSVLSKTFTAISITGSTPFGLSFEPSVTSPPQPRDLRCLGTPSAIPATNLYFVNLLTSNLHGHVDNGFVSVVFYIKKSHASLHTSVSSDSDKAS
jgi:hypothetical protein